MIIPPAAVIIGTLTILVRLFLSGLIVDSEDQDEMVQPKYDEIEASELRSSCRFRSKAVPYRDLSSSLSKADNSSPETVVSSANLDDGADDTSPLTESDEDTPAESQEMVEEQQSWHE